jgi:DNA (cytosine-5)-methyltransferase 1
VSAYYNEIDLYAAQWLRELMKKGLIADGEVDTRSIVDIRPADLAGFTQCHFFAGIGGWSLAARLAGWSDERPLWTGSAPCQPFSVAGKGKAQADERHLWPVFFDLIRACRPAVLMGEQVAAAVGKDWLDGVCSDLEGIGYACGAAVVPACAVDAPHRRDRVWFVADAGHLRGGNRTEPSQSEITTIARFCSPTQSMDNAASEGLEGHRVYGSIAESGYSRTGIVFGSAEHSGDDVADAVCFGRQGQGALGEPINSAACGGRQASDVVDAGAGFWHDHRWAIGADGKARRIKPGIRLLAHGVPARVGRLRAYGNAIVPQVAAEIIGAYMDVHQ